MIQISIHINTKSDSKKFETKTQIGQNKHTKKLIHRYTKKATSCINK